MSDTERSQAACCCYGYLLRGEQLMFTSYLAATTNTT